MTASHYDRVGARTQPLILIEDCLFRATEYAVKFAQEFDRAEIRDHNDRIVQRFQ